MDPVGAARLDVGLELEPLELLAIRCATRIASLKPRSGGSRSKSTKSGRWGLSTREYQAFMSMQFICTIQSSASGELTSGKSVIRDSPPRRTVRKVRVGIQLGIPFGACFWKYASPARP